MRAYVVYRVSPPPSRQSELGSPKQSDYYVLEVQSIAQQSGGPDEELGGAVGDTLGRCSVCRADTGTVKQNSILQHIIFCFSSAYLPDASDA